MQTTGRLELSACPVRPTRAKRWGAQAIADNYPSRKIRLLITSYFGDKEDGEISPTTDSTPLIRRFQSDYPARSALSGNPAMVTNTRAVLAREDVFKTEIGGRAWK